MDNMTSPGTLDLALSKKDDRGQGIEKHCDYKTDMYVHYVEKRLVIMRPSKDIKKCIDK